MYTAFHQRLGGIRILSSVEPRGEEVVGTSMGMVEDKVLSLSYPDGGEEGSAIGDHKQVGGLGEANSSGRTSAYTAAPEGAIDNKLEPMFQQPMLGEGSKQVQLGSGVSGKKKVVRISKPKKKSASATKAKKKNSKTTKAKSKKAPKKKPVKTKAKSSGKAKKKKPTKSGGQKKKAKKPAAKKK